jgi:hypothetical protein
MLTLPDRIAEKYRTSIRNNAGDMFMSKERTKESANAKLNILQLISAIEGTPVKELYERLNSSDEFTTFANAVPAISPTTKRYTIRPAEKKAE